MSENRKKGLFPMSNIDGASLKSDLNTIEAPIFSLEKKIDSKVFVWKNNNYKVVVRPSSYGRPTMWDKDIVLYLIGQFAAQKNRGGKPTRTIWTTNIDILNETKRGNGGNSYNSLITALKRLRNTSIETNMPVGDYIEIKEFSLIQGWRSIECVLTKRQLVEITLSEWLYQSILNKKILTYDKQYFDISRAFEKRLYEIFRRHLGKSSCWKIGEKKLFHKFGGRASLSRFRYELKKLEGSIVGFRFNYDDKKRMIKVYKSRLN